MIFILIGLANPRDFEIPTVWFEDTDDIGAVLTGFHLIVFVS